MLELKTSKLKSPKESTRRGRGVEVEEPEYQLSLGFGGVSLELKINEIRLSGGLRG
jgi:hypothetical protein